ncbi:hypothetical protein OIE68_18935 [Nocardia vinacea]|uniref:hypothetical protein n=1 Tax=Nocardia vinacea TaxID=96468 RepID=UPI002E10A79F|nr:hypothetical protein OIE68_18935 [Nocardia vinacea]
MEANKAFAAEWASSDAGGATVNAGWNFGANGTGRADRIRAVTCAGMIRSVDTA